MRNRTNPAVVMIYVLIVGMLFYALILAFEYAS